MFQQPCDIISIQRLLVVVLEANLDRSQSKVLHHLLMVRGGDGGNLNHYKILHFSEHCELTKPPLNNIPCIGLHGRVSFVVTVTIDESVATPRL